MDGDSIEALVYHNATRYAFVASFTVSLYDILLTFEDELTWVWMRRWSLGKVLFLMNRYIPPLVIACNLYSALCPSNIPFCQTYFVLSATFNILCITVIQMILALRTYALYLTNFWMYALGALSLSPSIAALFLSFWMHFRWIVVDAAPPFSYGCFNVHCRGSYCRGTWVVMNCYYLIFETIIFVLAGWRYIQTSRSRRNTHLEPELGRVLSDFESTFLRTLFQDGFLFYAAVAVIAIANLLLTTIGPPSLTHLFAGPTQALRSALCSRLFLHLRSCHQADRERLPELGSSTAIPLDPITFSRRSSRRNRVSRPK